MTSLSTSLQFGLGGTWLAEHTLRTVGAGLAIFDREGRLSQWDDRAGELLGVDGDGHSLPGLSDVRWQAIHLDGAPVTLQTDPIRGALTLESSSVADVVGVVDELGDTRWLAVTALPLPGLDGTTQAALVSLLDVTGIIRDRAAVDLAELLGRSAFDNGVVPMCVADSSGHLVDWNRSFAERLDRPDYELLASRLDSWVVADRLVLPAPSRPTVSVVPARWVDDGAAVVVRSWRSDRGERGRTMVELAPPSMVTDMAA